MVNTGQNQRKRQLSGFLFLQLWKILQTVWKNNRLISSLFKVFAMLEIRLSYEEEKLDTVYLKCINCKRETGLDPETSFYWLFHNY